MNNHLIRLCAAVSVLLFTSTGYVAAFDDDEENITTTSKKTNIIDVDTGYCNWGYWRYYLLLVEMKKSKSHPDYIRMKQESNTCTKKEDEMAGEGDIEAIYRIGSRFEGGYGLYDYNRAKARQYLEQVLKETDEDSTRYRSIKIRLDSLLRDEKNGRPNIVPASVMKTMRLAFAYAFGSDKNFPKDLTKAERLYEQARQAGSAKAAYKLYELQKDTVKGKQFLIEAATQGWVPAMGTLAFNLYLSEHKVFEQDLDAAEKWAKLALANNPKTYTANLVIKSLPAAREHQQRNLRIKADADRKRAFEFCRKPVKPLFEETLAGGGRQVTLQSKALFLDIYMECTFTTTGIKDKSGHWNGPYKVVRDLDGFEIYKGYVKNGKLTGQLVVIQKFPLEYDVKRDPRTNARSFLTLASPIDVNTDTIGFELFDYDFLKGRKPNYYFQKISIVDSKMVNMKEVSTDEVLLYEGTAFRGRVKSSVEIGTTHKIGQLERYSEKWFALYSGANRLDGRCLYKGKMEHCSYRYLDALVGNGKTLRRIDDVGQQRRRQYLVDLEIQMRNYGYAEQQVARFTSSRKRAEARAEQESAERSARDDANKKRWAREKSADKRRMEQDQARMFNRTFGGGVSASSSSDINDPLNPNNPINRQMQQQTQTVLRNHANKQAQAQAKQDYQAKLVQRKREIEVQKGASVERRLAQQRQTNQQAQSTNNRDLSGPGSTRYSSPATTHKQFMTSKVEDKYANGIGGWDCVNHWRADKCGDRRVTHSIHPLAPGVTGQGKNISPQAGTASGNVTSSSGGSSSAYAANDDHQSGTGRTTPSESEKGKVKSPKQLQGDSGSYYYDMKHAIDLAQTEIMNEASKYCDTSYKVNLAWHDKLAECKQLNNQFRCIYHAKVTCLSASCGSRFCGTGR